MKNQRNYSQNNLFQREKQNKVENIYLAGYQNSVKKINSSFKNTKNQRKGISLSKSFSQQNLKITINDVNFNFSCNKQNIPSFFASQQNDYLISSPQKHKFYIKQTKLYPNLPIKTQNRIKVIEQYQTSFNADSQYFNRQKSNNQKSRILTYRNMSFQHINSNYLKKSINPQILIFKSKQHLNQKELSNDKINKFIKKPIINQPKIIKFNYQTSKKFLRQQFQKNSHVSKSQYNNLPGHRKFQSTKSPPIRQNDIEGKNMIKSSNPFQAYVIKNQSSPFYIKIKPAIQNSIRRQNNLLKPAIQSKVFNPSQLVLKQSKETFQQSKQILKATPQKKNVSNSLNLKYSIKSLWDVNQNVISIINPQQKSRIQQSVIIKRQIRENRQFLNTDKTVISGIEESIVIPQKDMLQSKIERNISSLKTKLN